MKEYQDFGGTTANGAHIGRQHLSEPPDMNGYGEERNSIIVGEIIMTAPNHSTPTQLCGVLDPKFLQP